MKRWMLCRDHILLFPKPNRLMQKKNNGVDACRKTMGSQEVQGLINGILTQHIMYIGFDACLNEDIDCASRVFAAVPAHGNGTAVLTAKQRNF